MNEFERAYNVGKTLCIIALALISGQVFGQDNEQEKLAELQAELRARQQVLDNSKASAKELADVLKASELDIAKVAKKLTQTNDNLRQLQAEQQSLQQEQSSLKAAIRQQQSLLSSQLKSAFMAGHYDYAKMMFYQEDAKTFERVITYYQYLAKARQSEITKFKDNVARLETVTASLAEKAASLLALLDEQKNQRAVLLTRQNDRKKTLAKLNQTIASESERIAALQEDEKALREAIEAARIAAQRAAEAAQISLDGLAKLKGKLSAPVEGRVRKLFGNRRQGQVRWKGIIIDGEEGDAVKSIASGKVLYADWLRGFGLVAIVDHGEG